MTSWSRGSRRALAILLACALLPAARAAAQAVQPLFLHPAFYVGTQPQCIASGDFDRDGRPDLVTADAHGSSVSILLGQGNGNFTPAGSVRLGSGPTCMAVADLDADGDPDLATAHSPGNVSLLPGEGDGSFAAGADMDVGAAPEAIVAADFDLDGLLDLATADEGSDTVSILLGTGGGSFAAQPVVHVAQSPVALAAGDFDGDGREDLAVTMLSEARVGILLNRASPTGTDLGSALAGAGGKPFLAGAGTLLGHTKNELHLVNAAPLAPALLFAGIEQADLPFKGGTLVPAAVAFVPQLIGASGGVSLTFALPEGVPSGVTIFFQEWVVDAGASHGAAASNAVRGLTP